MTTRVFIVEAAYKDQADGYAEQRGWGGPMFVQPLSADGKEPVTHWGFPAVVGPAFLKEWDNPPEEAAALVAQIEIDDCPADADDPRSGMDTAAHWWDALAARGLKSVDINE